MPFDVICPDLSAGPSGSPGHVGCGSPIVEPSPEFFRRPGQCRDGDEAQAFLAFLAALAVPFLAAASSAGFLATISSIAPPAFSTAATAPFDAPATLNESLLLNSPLPSRRTPSLPPRATPAAWRAA